MLNPKPSLVQQNGQITLPTRLRRKFGIKSGDMVYFDATPEGIVIKTRTTNAMKLLDELGKALKEVGVTYDQMVEDGNRIREELVKEKYGITDKA